MTVEVESLDRRARRRQETIEEILDVAVDVMAEEGVAALSLAEVARRVGIKPPSLYKYFPSKLAVYDALFGQGNRELLETCRAAQAARADADPATRIRVVSEAFFRWSLAHPVVAQLMFWRTVPGFEPSPESYELSLQQVSEMRGLLLEAVAAGQLHPDAATEAGIALHTSVMSGLLSQQLANEPDASFETGRFTALLPEALDMLFTRFAPEAPER